MATPGMPAMLFDLLILWQHVEVESLLTVICSFSVIVYLASCAVLPGLEPSGTVPFQIWWVNSGLLSFISITLITMSIGFSTWLPLRSTAWALSWRKTKASLPQNYSNNSHIKRMWYLSPQTFKCHYSLSLYVREQSVQKMLNKLEGPKQEFSFQKYINSSGVCRP